MTESRRDWRLVGRPRDTAAAVFPHVVSRVGTAVRTTCENYDGAHVHRGVVIFAGSHRAHLLSVALGRESATDGLAVQLLVHDNTGAIRAVVTFPGVVLVCLLAGAALGSGPAGLLAGLGVGVLAGAGSAWAVFELTRRESSVVSGRMVAVTAELERALEGALGPLGLELERATVHMAGLDGGDVPEDLAWDAAVAAAAGGLAD